MIRIDTTPEQKADIEAHWAKARAGLHQPEAHDFGIDAKSSIAMHKYRSMALIEEAARHARLAADLAEAQS